MLLFSLGSLDTSKGQPVDSVSVVIPLHNEENSILPAFTEITRELENAGMNFEIVYVDVSSRDRSGMIVSRLAEHHPYVQALTLQRNLGRNHAEALRLGASCARHEVILFPGNAGQLPAAEIPHLVGSLQTGVDLVCGARKSGMRSKLSSQLFRFFLRRSFELDLRDFCSPIRVMRRVHLNNFLKIKGFDRLLPLYFKLKGLNVLEKTVAIRRHNQTPLKTPGTIWVLPEIWRLKRQIQLKGLSFLEEAPSSRINVR